MRNLRSVALVGVCLAAPALPAAAQDLPPDAVPPTSEPEGADRADNTGVLAPSNEIIVSARRREESVQDVPQTVNVVTSAQVEKLNLRNFQEIQSIVPGLTLQQTSAFSSQATVRGVAFVPEASGNNPSVEFYLNDAPISSSFLFQSTFDFGQFELQRGPQGTLRGRAAPSGQIAVTARRPSLDRVSAVFNGTITDLHARKVDGAFNIPIIADVLAIRIAGVIDNNRNNLVNSIKEVSDPDNNPGPYRRTKSIRGTVRFEPTDWAQFNFMYQSLNAVDHTYTSVASNSLFVAGAPQTGRLIRPSERLSLEDQGSFSRQDHDVYIGNADFRFAGQKLSYVGSYSKQDYDSLSSNDAADFFSPPRVPLVRRTIGDRANFEPVCAEGALRNGLNATSGSFYQCTRGISTRESHELRLASDERLLGFLDYVAGVFYDHNEPNTNLTMETPFLNAATGVVNPNISAIIRPAKSTEKAVFGNLTAHLLDNKLELSGGLRYIDYKDFSGLLQSANAATATTVACGPTNQGICNLSSSINSKTNATIYTASAKYQFTRDFMVYALTGTSFRPGPQVIGNFSVGPTGVEGPGPDERRFLNLPAERSRGYEIGAKTSFLDGRGRFNVAAYYQKFRNYPFRTGSQYINYTRNATTGAITAAPANFNFVSPVPVTVKGIEGEASFQILPRWSVGVNASYSDGKIKNGTVACTDLDRNGIPDVNPPTPSLAQLQAALGPGRTLASCSGVNRRSLTTPKFSANIQSELGFDFGDSVDAFVRGSATISGKTAGSPESTFDDIGSFGRLNVFAGVRDPDGAWELTVFSKNVLRERHLVGVGSSPLSTTPRNQNGATQAPVVSEYRSASVTAPREFGLTAKIALGSR